MKKLRLLLLGLLTPLFIGSSFAFDLSSDEITYLNNNALYQGSYSNQHSYTLYYDSSISIDNEKNLCVVFSGFSSNKDPSFYSIISMSNDTTTSLSSSTLKNFTTPYYLVCINMPNPYMRLLSDSNNSDIKFSATHYWVINATQIFNGYLGFDVQGLLDNYNNCQSDLNNCDTITSQCIEDKGILSGQLASCNSDKNSLQNYNDALSSQLNECLNNQGTGGFGTGITLVNNSLFWYLDDNLLSLPITNNLFLPLGYQGALDSGNVLYISKLSEEQPTQYYFTEEDKISIIDILSYLFIFILGIGIIFSLIKLFKKIFTH